LDTEDSSKNGRTKSFARLCGDDDDDDVNAEAEAGCSACQCVLQVPVVLVDDDCQPECDRRRRGENLKDPVTDIVSTDGFKFNSLVHLVTVELLLIVHFEKVVRSSRFFFKIGNSTH
jgi:hypothetical protein